jgi:hypothetical protein
MKGLAVSVFAGQYLRFGAGAPLGGTYSTFYNNCGICLVIPDALHNLDPNASSMGT